jgi:glycosyltransferase involved in cell wall biosynthesis
MAEIYRAEFSSDSTTIAYGANEQYSTEPELVRQCGVESNDYYLVVARMVPDNNADLIVKEFARSASRKRLVVVGDVPYKDAYADSVKAIGDPRIMFTGYVYDPNMLRELYCNCFAYIHGHEHGGTNPTLLKALGNGCCILALDTVFSREVLADGQYGLFFKKDSGALKESLEVVEGNDALVKRLRDKSRDRVRAAYTWERIASQYDALFRSM